MENEIIISYKFYLPFKVTSNISGYELLLRFHNDISHIKNSKINISFKNVEWFEANLVAVLGAIIEDLESKGNNIELIEYESFKIKTEILFRNGFFPHFNINVDNLFKGTTQIPYKKFKENESSFYNDYIQQELLDNTDFPRHSSRLGREI